MPKTTKRGNLEGTIRQRPNGLWESRISIGYNPQGKPVRRSLYGNTRQEVADKLAAALRARQQGLTLHGEKQTLGQFLTQWLETVVEPKVRPATYRSYEGIVRLHIIPALGRIPLSKLTPQQVQAFLRQQHETGRVPRDEKKKETPPPKDPATKRTWKNYVPKPKPVKEKSEVPPGVNAEHIRRVLRAALGHALKWDLIARNAAALAAAPKAKRHEIRFLDPDQAKAFLAAIKGHPNEALYTVALAVGLRIGEALGLKWSDWNRDDEMLTVRQQLQRVKGQLVFSEPKTAKARRSIPLPKFAHAALCNHWTVQQTELRTKAKARWQESGLIFTSEIGTGLDDRNVRRALYAVLEANKLPKLRFHDLRHSCATLLLSQGCDPRTIMETLGHSQITLTLNTYSHVIPALQRDAAEKMEKLFTFPSES